MFDSYDPARVPAVPLPIPDGARPGRLTLLPLVTELVIETVIASDAVTVLPSWIAAPYLASGRVAGIQVGREAQGRTWYAATRRGGLPEHGPGPGRRAPRRRSAAATTSLRPRSRRPAERESSRRGAEEAK